MPKTKVQNIEKACKGFKPETEKAMPARATKAGTMLTMLTSRRGASVSQLQQATGWQAHSVRGFLSGTVKKKLGLSLAVTVGKDGRKRYRIENRAVGQ